MAGRANPIVIPKQAGGGTPPPALPPVAGLGRLRKIALVGSAPTVDFAPWFDPSWEIWSHAICVGRCKRVDRLFEMHPDVTWRHHKKPQWPTYLEWLTRCATPIYMLEKHADIPASVRYPRERIFAECRSMIGREHFGSQADFMIALALSEGVTHIGLYGLHYVDSIKDGDRNEQLMAFKFWLGVAAGKGVSIVTPKGNPVFDLPAEIYGYESHATKDKYAQRLLREQALLKAKGKGGSQLERLRPADGAPLKPLPPNDHVGSQPAPENWAQFEAETQTV